MKLAKVLGTVVATEKDPKLQGFKFLMLGLWGHDNKPSGGSVVAVDAVGSRFAIDHETSLRRMEAAGAVATTTESALFEWCDAAGTPEFKQISALVREEAPAETDNEEKKDD